MAIRLYVFEEAQEEIVCATNKPIGLQKMS